MQIVQIFRNPSISSGGTGNTTHLVAPDSYGIGLSQKELDELYSSLLVSDSPVAQSIASNLSKYAKKVSFR